VDLYLAQTVAHELGHGIGMNHHKRPSDGARNCLMRYESEADAPLSAADPFWLRRYNPFPDQFCREPSHTYKDQGCFKAIKITDYQEK
jgi:hypothetical protein